MLSAPQTAEVNASLHSGQVEMQGDSGDITRQSVTSRLLPFPHTPRLFAVPVARLFGLALFVKLLATSHRGDHDGAAIVRASTKHLCSPGTWTVIEHSDDILADLIHRPACRLSLPRRDRAARA